MLFTTDLFKINIFNEKCQFTRTLGIAHNHFILWAKTDADLTFNGRRENSRARMRRLHVNGPRRSHAAMASSRSEPSRSFAAGRRGENVWV